MIEVLKQIQYLIPATLVIASITYSINYLDITELEKKLMTNFQQMKIYISLIFSGSLIITIFFLSLILINEKSLEVSLIIGSFITSFVLLLIISLIIWIANLIFSIKPKYFVKLENDSNPWDIFKATGNKELVLNREDEFIVIKDYTGLLIKKQSIPNSWKQSFYRRNKWFYLTVIGIIVVFVFSCISLYFAKDLWIGLLSFLVLIISMVKFMVIIGNAFWYKMYYN